MSDTTTCSNCGTEVPAAAAFCTGCGQSLRSSAPPAPPPPMDPPVDPTQVETPGLNDVTQVAPPLPSPPAPSAPPSPFAAPSYAPPPPDGTPPGPWGPSSTAPGAPPAGAPWNPPTQEPAAPPTWQQPVAPPGAYAPVGAPPAGAPSWGAQPGPGTQPPPWGEQPAAPASSSKGSVLGGLVGVVGSVLAIAGIFSGWVKLGNTGTVTAWSLIAGEGLIKTQTPYVILALAAFALATSLVLFTGMARTLVRIITALLGIAIIGVTAANWAQIAAFVTDNFPSSFEATTAIGFYFTIAGGVLVIIASLLPAKK